MRPPSSHVISSTPHAIDTPGVWCRSRRNLRDNTLKPLARSTFNAAVIPTPPEVPACAHVARRRVRAKSRGLPSFPIVDQQRRGTFPAAIEWWSSSPVLSRSPVQGAASRDVVALRRDVLDGGHYGGDGRDDTEQADDERQRCVATALLHAVAPIGRRRAHGDDDGQQSDGDVEKDGDDDGQVEIRRLGDDDRRSL